MFLSGLDELDRKIVQLLIENARSSYSDIGQQIGISRVAVKARIQALEAFGGQSGHHADIPGDGEKQAPCPRRGCLRRGDGGPDPKPHRHPSRGGEMRVQYHSLPGEGH